MSHMTKAALQSRVTRLTYDEYTLTVSEKECELDDLFEHATQIRDELGSTELLAKYAGELLVEYRCALRELEQRKREIHRIAMLN